MTRFFQIPRKIHIFAQNNNKHIFRMYIRNKNAEPKDYKERFEFRLTVDKNLICQRYFQIPNFNELSVQSLNLAETLRDDARLIDSELRSKSRIYLEINAPYVFQSKAEMESFISKLENQKRLILGECFIIRDDNYTNFIYKGNGVAEESETRYDEGEFAKPIQDSDRITYKLAFLIDEKEVCSTIWEGVYPRFVRNSIDLDNKRGRFEGEGLYNLNYEQYLLRRMSEGRGNLTTKIINDLTNVCSRYDHMYNFVCQYGNRTYKNVDDKTLAYRRQLRREERMEKERDGSAIRRK